MKPVNGIGKMGVGGGGREAILNGVLREGF